MTDHAEEILDPSTQREDLRIAVYAPARLFLADGTEHPCEVLNVSAGGAMIRMDACHEGGGEAVLGLTGVGRFPGHVAWRHEQFLGLAFDEKLTDIERLVAALSASARAADERRNYKRTSVLWRGRLYAGGKTHEIRVMNISAAGAKLRGPVLAENTAVMLIIERLGEVPARVVWADQDQLGIRFLDPPHEVCDLFGDLLPAVRAKQRDDFEPEPR